MFVRSSDQFTTKHMVESKDVHMLGDGLVKVKHSSEIFYAGSLWKAYYFLILYLSKPKSGWVINMNVCR